MSFVTKLTGNKSWMSFLATLVVLELTCVFAFPFFTGKSLDFSMLLHERSERIQFLERRLQTDRAPGEYSLHPYLGYSGRPGTPDESPQRYNAYGLPAHSGRDFPYKKNEGEYVIAVVGGSVAERFALLGGEQHLQEQLGTRDRFREKKIVLLSLGTGGYKQPQGLFLLQFVFLSGFDIDAVINLDGFNEMVFAVENVRNGYNPIFPSVFHLGILQKGHLTGFDEDTAKSIILLRSAERNQMRLARWLTAFPIRYSAAANTFGEVFLSRWERQRAELERKMIIQHATSPFDILSPPDMEDLTPAQFAVRIWTESSRMMFRECRGRGIPYLHVLQPNQYVPDSKPMNQSEKKAALDAEFTWGITVRENYHLLRQAGAALAAEGVPFLDLTQVFRDVEEELYIDNCCHFNERGNALIAPPIAEAFAAIAD